MPATQNFRPKRRGRRSGFPSIPAEQRELVYDKAKRTMEEHANRMRAERETATQRVPDRSAGQPQKQPETPKPSDQAAREVSRPVGIRKPANAGVNRQRGNPRFGQKFRTERARGGEFHVYGDGKRVFVPTRGGSTSKGSGGKVGEAIQQVAAMREQTAGGRNVPRPGQGGGVIRQLSKKRRRA